MKLAELFGHCRTCAHWTPFTECDESKWDPEYVEEDLHKTSRVSLVLTRHLGLCRKAQGVDPIDATTLAIAEDGSDYIANFRTAAEFGCVMHEEKR